MRVGGRGCHGDGEGGGGRDGESAGPCPKIGRPSIPGAAPANSPIRLDGAKSTSSQTRNSSRCSPRPILSQWPGKIPSRRKFRRALDPLKPTAPQKQPALHADHTPARRGDSRGACCVVGVLLLCCSCVLLGGARGREIATPHYKKITEDPQGLCQGARDLPYRTVREPSAMAGASRLQQPV